MNNTQKVTTHHRHYFDMGLGNQITYNIIKGSHHPKPIQTNRLINHIYSYGNKKQRKIVYFTKLQKPSLVLVDGDSLLTPKKTIMVL